MIPGAGFGTHGHQDMEIILTYVLEGELAIGSFQVMKLVLTNITYSIFKQ